MLLAPRRSISSGGRLVITMRVAGGVLAAGLVTYSLVGLQQDPRSAIDAGWPSVVASLGGVATIGGAALLLVMLPLWLRTDGSL
jgi:hypothetical protein